MATRDAPVDERADPVLLVTGGSRGIGAAVARQAVSAGYRVCLSYAGDEESARRTERDLGGASGRAVAVRADVADPAAVARLFDTCEARLGPVSAVVSNAGVTGAIGPFPDASLEDIRRVLEVNVLGTIVVAQHAVRRWLDRGHPGTLVNLSSVAAVLGAPHEYVHYAASKAAVEAFTVGLGKEVAEAGIRVNAVAPGVIATGIHAAAGEPDRPQRVAVTVPMRRVGEPDEVARAVLWLLSPESSYVTATVLRVAGGR